MNESRGLSLLFAEKDSTLITNSNSAKLIVETTKFSCVIIREMKYQVNQVPQQTFPLNIWCRNTSMPGPYTFNSLC